MVTKLWSSEIVSKPHQSRKSVNFIIMWSCHCLGWEKLHSGAIFRENISTMLKIYWFIYMLHHWSKCLCQAISSTNLNNTSSSVEYCNWNHVRHTGCWIWNEIPTRQMMCSKQIQLRKLYCVLKVLMLCLWQTLNIFLLGGSHNHLWDLTDLDTQHKQLHYDTTLFPCCLFSVITVFWQVEIKLQGSMTANKHVLHTEWLLNH